MKKLSRSIIMGMALSLMVLVGLTGSAAAAKPEPSFIVGGPVTCTWDSTAAQAKLEAWNLRWTGYRPDTACISVWSSDGSSLIVRACGSAIKGSDEKYPQDLYVGVMIDKKLFQSSTTYNLRVDLMRHGKVIAFSGLYPMTSGTVSTVSSPQP